MKSRDTNQPSQPVIVLQNLETGWSKRSRGGINAAARNRTPEAVQLPATSTTHPPELSVLIHKMGYGEAHNFQSSTQGQLQVVPFTEPFRYNCLKLSYSDDMLHITLEWERNEGSSRRVNFLREGFALQRLQWGRVRYNTRIARDYGWEYKKYVFNIGLFDVISPEVFLTSQAAHTYSNMVYLR